MYKPSLRKPSGGLIILVVFCLFALIVVAYGGIQLSLVLNSSQKIRNSVDAAVLNIATRAPDLKVNLRSEEEFGDCADKEGKIGLANINRVWAKAYLQNLNAQEMTYSGQLGSGGVNADKTYERANRINNRLKQKLLQSDFFKEQFAALNVSKQAPLQPTATFRTSCIRVGEQSNIAFHNQQFPGKSGPVSAAVIKDDCSYLPGYTKLEANKKQFSFITFRQDETPHLISLGEFEQQADETIAKQCLPNAFSASGSLGGSKILSASAAIANVQHNYKLAIPHSYVSIKLQPTEVTWLINGKKAAKTKYEFAPVTHWGLRLYDLECGWINGYASLGNEYREPTLYNVICALPGDHRPVFDRLLQRLREIDATMTMSRLVKLLSSQEVIPDTYDYVIYPKYRSTDATDPKITIAAQEDVHERWYQTGLPDGTEAAIAWERAINTPNKNWAKIGGDWRLKSHYVAMTGQLLWTPGTGCNQCLGLLRIERTADVMFKGRCE